MGERMSTELALFENTQGLTQRQQATLLSKFGASFERYTNAAKSENTRRTYDAQWRQFEQFCADEGFTPLPCHPAVVKAYLVSLADKGLSLSSVKVARAAIAYHHDSADLPNPTTTKSINKLMSGIANEIGRAAKKKDALALDDLAAMVATLDASTPRGALDRALLLVGFVGAFRRSELVGLDLAQVKVNGAVTISLGKSKTDQTGEKDLKKTIPHIDHPLCAHCALLAWLDVRGNEPGALFRRIVRGKVSNKRPSARYLARLVQDAAKDAGIHLDVAGHSLRSGFITNALGSGATLAQVVGQTHQTYDTALGYDQGKAQGATRAVQAIYGDEG
jgi:site-specific recombinase XerD